MGDLVEQSHSGPGDNVAGDKNITVQPTSQQGIVGNDSTTINIQTVEQRFEAKTLEPTIDGPPNNLKVYG
ncbi:MAG: hypothetical protein VKL01_13075, partial [Limnothrix sp.]|nr:hypothetical protein [Limnothrix sp.]